ncbi:hypothetical protein G6F23_010467 [Rhizopus arrhizus]|nr:hypothetical protein G6F23_010467 [Rhizopus arrhizus]
MDEELHRITESNRYIPFDEVIPPIDLTRVRSLRSQDVDIRRHLLVFADKPSITKKSDRIMVKNHYGAGPEGQLAAQLKPKRRQRSYLVACDFSDESFNAIEWTMGTMMRDGDQLYVVTVVNRDDNPEAVKQAGLSLSKELQKASEAVTEKAKKILDQMLLFDVALITYAICGRVKDVLSKLISELQLTMVVCGSKGRGSMKGLFMGSISTYLVHKSPVPVTVIKPQKTKKTKEKKPVKASPLSESVESGQLAVDELSNSLTIRLWEWEDETKHNKKNEKSKRDWEQESKKLNEVQSLPPLSRTDINSANIKSLRDVELQQELWDYIMNTIWRLENSEDKKSWEPIVSQFRKLREGVYASEWSRGNYDFAIQGNRDCLRGLVDELYVIKKESEKPFYTVLDILYFCCYIEDKQTVMKRWTGLEQKDTKETQFAKSLIHCIFVSENPIEYFKLYQQAPYYPYRLIMDQYHEKVRIRAIKTLRKAYLSVSLQWAKIWLGLEQEVEVVPMMNQLMQCVDRVDVNLQVVHFIRSNNKKTNQA